MTKIVEVKKIFKDYYLKKITVNALKGVDLTITDNEFTALVGPSGSGKSTLLHIIGCIDKPTSGDVFFANESIGDRPLDKLTNIRRENIGFIFQAYNLIPVLTALENVAFPLIILGYDKKTVLERSREVINSVGLSGMEKRKPSEMSGGQQQRVAIARALVKKPKLILADEPTANLDSKTASEIIDLMLKMNQENGISFLFSTHDQLVMDFASRIVKIRDGLIQEDLRK